MSSTTRVALGRAALLVLTWSALSHLRLGLPDLFETSAQAAAGTAPGGFVEKSNATVVRARLSAAQIGALLPQRGSFSFPAPYGTEAMRLTNSSDCGGGDCVNSVGYSYWNNMNNSAGSNTLLAFVALLRGKGGTGPTLFSIDKTTGAVTKLGAMFASTSPYASNSGEGWYFSSTMPNALYVFRGMTLQRYDVMTHALTTVFDATAQFGSGNSVWQLHSSHDDRVHSGTLHDSAGASLGCFAYLEDQGIFKWYPRLGAGNYDECQIDASGRFLQIKEDYDGVSGVDNRVIDLQTGVERRHPWQSGAPGHSDNGYGFTIGEDAWNGLPNAFRVYPLDQDSWASAPVVYNNMDWNVVAPAHVSFSNARAGTPLSQQYACGSGANRSNTNRANEIECFRLDSTMDVLVVAPVMTDLNATGGGTDDYYKMPKGNLDPTGQFFMWTTNMGGARQDAFIVKVPSQLLVAGSGTVDASGPTLSSVRTASVDNGAAMVGWTSSEPADSQVDYGPTTTYGTSTVRNAAYVTTHAQALTGLASGTTYHYRVRSRDNAGNLSLSADQVFATMPDDPLRGLSAYWKLDEGAGSAVTDATGLGHEGLLVNGPVHVAGRTGLALGFDGVNDVATFPHDPALDSYPLSVAFWAKTTATGLAAFVNKYAASSKNGYQVFTSGGSLCAWYFRDASNYIWDGSGCSLPVTGINDGAWHQVTFVVDSSGGRLFVDGAQRASLGWTGTPGPATTAQGITFASYPGTAGPPLAGTLDDVRVYGRSLGAGEIAAIAAGPPRDMNAPVLAQLTARPLVSGATLVGWTTDEWSDTQLEYGRTTAYGSITPLSPTATRSHFLTLANLQPGTTYHCRARSKDGAGNLGISGDYVFITTTGGLSDGVTPTPEASAATPPSSSR
jgi:hypothetical protein